MGRGGGVGGDQGRCKRSEVFVKIQNKKNCGRGSVRGGGASGWGVSGWM